MIINVVRVNFAGDWWLSFERLFWDPAVFAEHNERLRGRWKKKKKGRVQRSRDKSKNRDAALPILFAWHASLFSRTHVGGSAFRITRLRKYFLNNFALTSMRRRSGSWIGEKKEKKKKRRVNVYGILCPISIDLLREFNDEGNWECERTTWK